MIKLIFLSMVVLSFLKNSHFLIFFWFFEVFSLMWNIEFFENWQFWWICATSWLVMIWNVAQLDSLWWCLILLLWIPLSLESSAFQPRPGHFFFKANFHFKSSNYNHKRYSDSYQSYYKFYFFWSSILKVLKIIM